MCGGGGGGVCAGACMVGGMHGRGGHMWQVGLACMAGGMHGRGCAWQWGVGMHAPPQIL